MERQANAILKAFGQGPFVFNLGHGFVPETPPENVAILSDLIRDWKG
jgi:uroporphyrinogen decarboxylase